MSAPVPSDDLVALADACMAAVAGRQWDGSADPARIAALAQRHRVSGLVAAALGDVAGIERATVASLRWLADYREVAAAFRSVEHLTLKGLAVAGRGYRQPLLKTAADLDLLIDEGALDDAAAALAALGYRRVIPEPHVRLREWHRVSNQSVWRRGGTLIELHHHVLTYSHLLESLGTRSAQLTVDLGGVRLPTFTDLDQFAYLSAHGAFSGWFRLKWLVDVVALLDRDEADAGAAFAHARALGVGRAAAQALLLREILFSRPVPESVRDYARRQFQVRRLVRLALRLLAAGEPRARRFGTLPQHESAWWLTGLAGTKRWRDLIEQRLLR